ncbi:UNVERIFIED_CONTAM: hypothetical protein HDU68_010618, partial [Siphonaria sp. JEL0065]
LIAKLRKDLAKKTTEQAAAAAALEAAVDAAPKLSPVDAAGLSGHANQSAFAKKEAAAEEKYFRDQEIVETQRRLNRLEEKHIILGKFVPENWKAGDSVPSGQAVVAKFVGKVLSVVDKQLIPIQLRLENVIRALKTFKTGLFVKEPVEPVELTSHQLQVDAIANL